MLPNPVFTFLGLEVFMYGICIAVGILCCFLTYYFFTKRLKMDEDVLDFSFYVIIVAIALGFLFAVLFQSCYNWFDNIAKWREAGRTYAFPSFKFGTGMTAMGGFIGGAAGFLLAYFLGGHFYFKFFKKGAKKGIHIKEFNKIFIVAPMCILIAHAFGRIGCLMSGCCHGELLSETEYVFGGIWMEGVKYGWGYYVPTQLYESLFLFATYGVLCWLFLKKRCNITMHIYLIAYGVWRIFIEFFRVDDRGYVLLGLAPSQWMSILFILGGVAMILYYYFKKIPFKYTYGTETETDKEKKLSESAESQQK